MEAGFWIRLGASLLDSIIIGIPLAIISFFILTFGIGIIISAFMVGLREDKRSIHDFIAGTEVVYD